MSAPSLRSGIVKDALTPLDFTSPNGGFKSPEQLQYFLDQIVKQPTLVADNRVEFMNGPEKEISKLGFGRRILHKTGSRELFTTDKESKPSSNTITLQSKMMKAIVPVTDDTFEDNIEGGALDGHITDLATKQVAVDMEEVGLLADPDSQDEDLTINTGLLLQVPETSIIDVSANPQAVGTIPFSAGLHKIPSQYKRNKADMRFYISDSTWESYTDVLAARNTILGDQYMTADPGVKVPLKGVSLYVVNWMPDDAYLLTDKNNIVWGIQRQVKVEKERVAREGTTYYVITVRFDVKFLDTAGVVLFKGLKPFSLTTE